MEAVPRLPMVSLDLKVSPDRPTVDFTKLKQYIRDFYNEDPESYSAEIRNLESLRAQAVHPVKDVTGSSVLKKYYCQLHFLQSRFPMGKDGAAAVQFTWKDMYATMVCSAGDIKFELVAILYNIGALHSQLGAADDRTTPEGLKLACTHFQCAAWAFQHLKDTYPQPSGVDLSPDLMQFMYHLCLAQAQECILEKSMTDNRKAAINAKVAAQIVDYYNMALHPLLQGSTDEGTIMDTVSTKLYKSWKKYTKFKATYYSSISLLYQGMQSEEQQKMGERVGYYQAALDKLNEAIKASKGIDNTDAISETLTFTRDVVEGKRKAAKNENEFIYHEEVPDAESLATIKGATLVKGIPFSVNDPEISGPDIFARLIPMKAHEASSLYSEEKAKLLRRISGMIDSKDEEVVSFMSCLQLEHTKAHLDNVLLPQEIVDRCAALSAKPDAIPNLIGAMDKLNDAYHDVDAMLKEIMHLVKTEEMAEKEYQEIMGTRPPSIVATDLTREANKYTEAHKKAAESNETLHRAMSQHIENLRVLQQPFSELQAQLPSLAPLNLSEDQTLKDVLMLVGKVDEMRRQRSMLACQLRESICSDDITTQLVTRQNENTDTIFQQEMQKHNRYVSLIEQNLVAQDKILQRLTDAYADYAPTRKATTEIVRQRDMMLSALVSSYDAYEDLIAKSAKGLEFYRKLETNLTKLLQRVKGTCKVQQEERDTILARNGRTPIPASVNEYTEQPSTPNRPKLKDYLINKKEGYKSSQSGGQVAPSSPYYNQQGYQGMETGQGWPTGVRPTPVGSEGTAPACSGAKQDYTSQPASAYQAYAKSYQGYQYPTSTLQGLQYPSLGNEVASSAPEYNAANLSQYQYHPISSNMPDSQYTQQSYLYSPSSQYPLTSLPSTLPSTHPSSMDHTYAAQSYQSQQPNGTTSIYTYQYPHMSQGQSAQPLSQGANSPQPSHTAQTYPNPPSQGQPTQVYPNQTVQPSQGQASQVYPNQTIQPSQGQATQVYPNQTVQPSQGAQSYQNQVVQPSQGTQSYSNPAVQPSQGAQSYQNQVVQPSQGTQSYSNPAVQPSQGTQSYPNQSVLPSQGTQSYPNQAVQSSQGAQSYSNQPGQPPQGSQSYPNQAIPASQSQSVQAYQSQSVQAYQNQTGQPSQGVQSYPNQPVQPSQGVQAYSNQAAQPSQGVQAYQNQTAILPQNQSSQAYHSQMVQPSQGVQPYQNQTILASQGQGGQAYQNPTLQTSQGVQLYQNYNPSSGQNITGAVQDPAVYQNQTSYNQAYTGYQAGYPTQQVSGGETQNDKNNPSSPYYSPYNSGKGSTYGAGYPMQNVPSTSESSGVQNYYGSYNYSYTTSGSPYSYATSTQGYYNTAQYPSVDQQNGLNSTNQQGYNSNPNYAEYYGHPYGVYQQTLPAQDTATYMQSSQNNSTVTYSQQQTNSIVSPTVPEAEKSSNVDLLAGLDFTVADAPLQPQQQPDQQPSQQVDNVSSITAGINSVAIQPTKPAETSEASPKKVQKVLNDAPSLKIEHHSPSKMPIKDPFLDPEVLTQFVQEVEKFEKFVEGLTSKTLNGPTPLDLKWNELKELEDKDSHKQIISVARCYPMKNRFPDILPFDSTRVELPSTKDDYINASIAKDLGSNCPNFILTQAPLPSTYADFWVMVLEKQVELIVCLLADAQMNGEVYWAVSKTEDLVLGKLRVALQSCTLRGHWVERIISVSDGKTSRVVVHLQFTAWPLRWFPESPGGVLSLVCETLSVWGQRRGEGGIVVHCDSGVGRTGVFIVTTLCVCDLRTLPHLPDLVSRAALVAAYRKNPLRDRDHLKFAYQCLLYYAQDLLMKRGILASKSTFEEKRTKTKSHTRHPSEDFLLNSLKESGQANSEERRASDASSTGSAKPSEGDPLSQIDPLWPIKRYS